jgi:hypothetical protein
MADVKFSELTNLAASAVATDDIFAVVDTSATTSKKLTVANLLGQVPSGAPLHINDTTDSTSGVTGAISTDGGLGVTLKSFLNGQVTFGTTVIPNASGTVDLGSAAKEFGDLYLGADKAIKFLADQSVTLTSSTGALTLNSTNKLQFGDTGTYIHQSADGVLDLVSDTELELNATTIDVNGAVDVAGATISGGALVPDASGTRDLGSTSAEWGDLYLGDDAVIYLQADSSTTLTGSGDGILLNSTHQFQFGDTGTYIHQSADGVLDLVADGEVELTGPIVDIDASTGLALDGANLNSNWLVNTTNQIRFHDTGQHISAPADGRLAVVSDGDIELTAGDIKVGVAGADGNVQSLTDAYDVKVSQYDGNEVARIFDGGKAQTGFTLVQTAKGGFGYRQSVFEYAPGTDDGSGVALTASMSGSLIRFDGTYSGILILPAVAAAEEGVWFDIVVTTATASGKTLQVRTNGAGGDNADNIFCHVTNFAVDSSSTDGLLVDVAGDNVSFPQSTAAGTRMRIVCAKGGAAEMWMADIGLTASVSLTHADV